MDPIQGSSRAWPTVQSVASTHILVMVVVMAVVQKWQDKTHGHAASCLAPVLQSHLSRSGCNLSSGLLQQFQAIGAVRAAFHHRLIL